MPKNKPEMQETPTKTPPKQPEKTDNDKKPSIVLWVGLVAAILLIGGFVYFYFFWNESAKTGNGADQTTPVQESTTGEDTEDEDAEGDEEDTDTEDEETSDPYEGWETYTYDASDFEAAEEYPSHEYSGTFTFKHPAEYDLTYGQCSWGFEETRGQICWNMGTMNFGLESIFNTNIAYFKDLILFDLTNSDQAENFEERYTEVSSETLEGYDYEVKKIEATTETNPGYEETVYVYKVDAETVGFRFDVAPSKVDEYEDTILKIITSIEIQ